MVLVEEAKVLYKDEYYQLDIDNMVYSFGSSTSTLLHSMERLRMQLSTDIDCHLQLSAAYYYFGDVSY